MIKLESVGTRQTLVNCESLDFILQFFKVVNNFIFMKLIAGN